VTGGQADADLAAAALDAVYAQARTTLEHAVAQAPIDSPEDAAERGRVPGALKASGHIVLLVNEEAFDTRHGGADQARERVRALAGARRLYRMDAEIRFDRPYARYQHDNLSLRHEHGGKAKYLEHPLQIARPKLRDRFEELTSR
jgi:hypothetical protein